MGFWTEEEINIIKEYNHLKAWEIAEMLEGRTPKEVQGKRYELRYPHKVRKKKRKKTPQLCLDCIYNHKKCERDIKECQEKAELYYRLGGRRVE